VVKVIATILLGIMIGLNELAAAFGDTAARAEADRMKGLVDKMWAPAANELAIAEGEAARAAWRNAAGQNDAADAAAKAAQQFTNVPSGYRMALARYNADLGITGPVVGGGGGTTVNIYGDINSSAETVENLAEDAKKEAARERGQQRGTGAPPRGRGGRD
jgi:hypothetical protein